MCKTRLWITEEQQAEDALSLYLLRSLQGKTDAFWQNKSTSSYRIFLLHRSLVLKSIATVGRSLNKRINTQERHRNHKNVGGGFFS